MRYEATAVGDRVAALKQAWPLNAVPDHQLRRFSEVSYGIGGRTHRLACRAFLVALCSFRTDAHYANSRM